jgi:crotonobetainyl-CoA:carnitine CoA-transferase CaiB-like acyl-CoA transferase
MEFRGIQQLKIIDLSTVLAGPSVGTFFSELGAEVIKIEHPTNKDITRSWKLPNEDKDAEISAYFSSVNYKKHYQFLDLRQSADHQKLMKLVENADIILMNFKRGDQEKLQITDAALRAVNNRLIIGKISGFGQDSDRVAYDLILQAESGIMSMNGTPESGPLKMPIALIDVLAAHHLKEGLLLALLERSMHSTYAGQTITVSLYDAAISSLVNQASNYLMGDHVPQRIGSLHPNIAPYGELFTTKDGVHITFAIGSNRHFQLLCNELGCPELARNDRYATVQARVENRRALQQHLQEKITHRDSHEFINAMHRDLVPCARINDLATVFHEKAAQAMVREEMIAGQLTKRVSSVAFKLEKE